MRPELDGFSFFLKRFFGVLSAQRKKDWVMVMVIAVKSAQYVGMRLKLKMIAAVLVVTVRCGWSY